jgi:D-inositol-3-phosphate glycosyltransferase
VPKDELPRYLPEFERGILDFAARKRLSYDVIHSHYWLSGQVGLRLREAWGLPVVQMFHTLGEMKNRVARSPEERASKQRIAMERRLLEESDRIIASTEAELAQFRWIYRIESDRAVVIEPGVDTARFYPIPVDEAREYVGAPDGRRIILFVGRIEPLKGLDSLLNAVAMLEQRGVLARHSIQLMVIGGEPDASPEQLTAEMSRLQSLTRELQIEPRVTFLGKRSQDTLQYYYSAAEVVVMPSHYESFGLVALEAMACGTPVVASETGGLLFLVRDGETGLHVPTADPAALAEKLELLLEDQELLTRLGNQAAKYARGFGWPGVADRVIQVYEQLVGARVAAEPRIRGLS